MHRMGTDQTTPQLGPVDSKTILERSWGLYGTCTAPVAGADGRRLLAVHDPHAGLVVSDGVSCRFI